MISVTQWIHWEIQRYLLATETPGKFGYFTSGKASR